MNDILGYADGDDRVHLVRGESAATLCGVTWATTATSYRLAVVTATCAQCLDIVALEIGHAEIARERRASRASEAAGYFPIPVDERGPDGEPPF